MNTGQILGVHFKVLLENTHQQCQSMEKCLFKTSSKPAVRKNKENKQKICIPAVRTWLRYEENIWIAPPGYTMSASYDPDIENEKFPNKNATFFKKQGKHALSSKL